MPLSCYAAIYNTGKRSIIPKLPAPSGLPWGGGCLALSSRRENVMDGRLREALDDGVLEALGRGESWHFLEGVIGEWCRKAKAGGVGMG